MQDASLEDLKRRIATGEYRVDSGELAGTILSKLALIRRAERALAGQGEEGAAGEARQGARRRARGGAPASSPQRRREQLQ